MLEDDHLIEIADFDRQRIPEASCTAKARVLVAISRCRLGASQDIEEGG